MRPGGMASTVWSAVSVCAASSFPRRLGRGRAKACCCMSGTRTVSDRGRGSSRSRLFLFADVVRRATCGPAPGWRPKKAIGGFSVRPLEASEVIVARACHESPEALGDSTPGIPGLRCASGRTSVSRAWV